MFSLVRMAVAGGAGTTDVPAGPDGGGGQDGGGVYPGGTTTVTDWVSFDGCSSTADTLSPNLDIEATLPAPRRR